MSAVLRLRDVGYRYAGAATAALSGVDLEVTGGEVVALTGAPGSGTTTLLLVGGGYAPRLTGGELTGQRDIFARTPAIVFAAPWTQLTGLCTTAFAEVAFGPACHALAGDRIRGLVRQNLDRLGVAHLAERDPATLSGGELQRVIVASALALEPDLLLLDDPAAELDPAGADALYALLREVAAEGAAVLVATPDTARAAKVASRVVALEAGRIAPDRLVEPEPDPSAGDWLGIQSAGLPVRWDNVWHDFGGGDVLSGVSLDVAPGECVALLGANGAGKTTLMRMPMGLVRPREGKVSVGDWDVAAKRPDQMARRAGYAFQHADQQLFARTVHDDVAFGPRRLGHGDLDVDAVLGELGLGWAAKLHPYDLPAPLRKLVALAGALVMRPAVLLLDEPTAGFDTELRSRVVGAVRRRREKGLTVIAISHDPAFVQEVATREVTLEQGRISADVNWAR